MLDYLAQEVLDRQPPELRRFLLETSILERLSGPLCDAVTSRDDGQAMLERAERANLFLVPLDDRRRWWRYHHLFADLLQARLAQTEPERVPGLHRSAAAWSEANGLADDAVRHALAAGDPGWAARLIEQQFDALLHRAEGATVDRWVEALPAELVRARPRLRLAQAVWAMVLGRTDAVEPLLADAERAQDSAGDRPDDQQAGGAATLVANVPASIAFTRAELARQRGDPERVAAYGRQAAAHLAAGDGAQRHRAGWYLAVADWFAGRVAEAEAALAGLLAEQRADGEGYLAVRTAYDLGQVRHARGRLTAALATYEQALEIAADAGPLLPPAGIAHIGLAEVHYERGELEAALDHADRGVRLCRQLTYGLPLLPGLAVLARARQARGDTPGALEAIAEAERVGVGPEVASLLDPVPATSARLALARGEVAAAARWARGRGLGPDDRPAYPREREQLVLARVLLAEGTPALALGLLRRLGELAAAQGRTASLIEVRLVQALALAAAGEARALAAPEGFTRLLLDEGRPLAPLLERVPGGDGARRRQAGAAAGLVEPLSQRELEVLELLAAGRSNREIAEELVVALDTVKKHVSHVLDKLGAANRTQAVARARQLQLLA